MAIYKDSIKERNKVLARVQKKTNKHYEETVRQKEVDNVEQSLENELNAIK